MIITSIVHAGGEDFTPFIMNVTFEIGETLKNITVSIIPDSIMEEDERFYVQLESFEGQPNSISKPDGAWVTIIDDDDDTEISGDGMQFSISTTVKVANFKRLNFHGLGS